MIGESVAIPCRARDIEAQTRCREGGAFPPQSAPIKPAGQSGRNYKYRRKAMNPERPPPTPRHDRADLQEHYGEIGISAVAAAVRY